MPDGICVPPMFLAKKDTRETPVIRKIPEFDAKGKIVLSATFSRNAYGQQIHASQLFKAPYREIHLNFVQSIRVARMVEVWKEHSLSRDLSRGPGNGQENHA